MQIIFFGTPDFAVPSLKALIEDQAVNVLAVLTQADKKVGRKQIITPPAIKLLAQEHGLEVLQPEKLNKDENVKNQLKELKPDFIVTVAYGQILKEDILNLAPVVNLHASLLPDYRGPAPINWSMIHGEKELGLTTMLSDKGVDTGDILLKTSVEIDENLKADQVSEKLSQLGAELLLKTLKKFKDIKAERQTPSTNPQKQLAPFMDKRLGEIDFQAKELILGSANPKQSDFKVTLENSAKNIFNLHKALYPWPGSYFMHADKKIILTDVNYSKEKSDLKPGCIIKVDKTNGSFDIACQSGVLSLNKVKAQGKSELLAVEWLNGMRLQEGDCL